MLLNQFDSNKDIMTQNSLFLSEEELSSNKIVFERAIN
jgi:hypothetical protein